MKVALTGAGEPLGRHLSERFARNHEVLPLRHANLDIDDVEPLVADALPAAADSTE